MINRNFNVFSVSNLKKIDKLIWDFLKQGVKNRKSAFHYPTVATSSIKTFSLRTVITREIIIKDRVIIFHTDIRSKKIQDLKQNNLIIFHIYDKKNNIQIQAEGKVKIFNKSKQTERVWNSLSNKTKASYLIKENPGKKINNEKDFSYLSDKEGYQNFTIVKTRINKITYLQLNFDGNKKAKIIYEKKNTKYYWLAP